ncbi:MAG: NAD(P)-dependent oxidoreductase [bacterium]|nr:NAD(P)-dependent oxidoreductase [bacterium]
MLNILLAEKVFSPDAKKILAKKGRVVDFVSRREFMKNLSKADVLVNALEIKLDKNILQKAIRLKLIGSRTTQLRYIDLDECKKRGIEVVNIKADSPVLQITPSTAEEAMALIFSVLRHIPWAFDSIKNGQWDRKKYEGRELYEKTVGLIGFGRLGKMVAKFCQAFGAIVIACDPNITAKAMQKSKVRKVPMKELLKKADIISLHSVYNDATFGMLKEEHFRSMRPTAIFINTARGEITDEKALLKALRQNWIAGSGIDTLAGEMPDGRHLIGNPLVDYARKNNNLIILPHLGGSTKEATERTQVYISELVARELKGAKYE